MTAQRICKADMDERHDAKTGKINQPCVFVSSSPIFLRNAVVTLPTIPLSSRNTLVNV